MKYRLFILTVCIFILPSCSKEYVCVQEWITVDSTLSKGPHWMFSYHGRGAKKRIEADCPESTITDTTANGYAITMHTYHYAK